jgi:hypothetical protein
MSIQGGEGVRAVTPVPQGGTIEVDVGANDSTVEVSGGNLQGTTVHQVEPGKRASIPVPAVPGGTILSICIGKGLRARIVLIEVVALFH